MLCILFYELDYDDWSITNQSLSIVKFAKNLMYSDWFHVD